MMNTALALREAGHEVHMYALNTIKHFVDPLSVPKDLSDKLHIRTSTIDTGIKIVDLVCNLFTNKSYNIVRFYSAEVKNDLESILQANNFDIIQLETLFTTPYIKCIRSNSTAKIVLRAHNVEHIIWQRLANKEKNIFRKYYVKLLAKRLKKYEIETLGKIDALLPITSVDESSFRKFNFKGPMLTVPLSLDFKDYHFDENQKTEMCLFHLGSMDWLPNREAINWFLEQCWVRIHELFPHLKLYLAGRAFPEEIIKAGYPNVICEGRIEDAHTYMREKQIMVVPLHSGSGMRVKIIQGMALGKTIISTTIGAEGIPASPGKNILIADSPENFITEISDCIKKPEHCRQVGINGRKFAEQIYTNAAVGRQLGIFYKAILKIT